MNVCWANKKLPQLLKRKKDEELSESKSELKQLKKQLKNSEQKIKMYKKQKDKYKQSYFEKRRKMSQLDKQSKSNRVKVEILEAKVEANAKSESTVEALKREIREYSDSIQYLQSLLEDTPDILLFNEDNKKYSDETFQCIMNLTDLKVPNKKSWCCYKRSHETLWYNSKCCAFCCNCQKSC